MFTSITYQDFIHADDRAAVMADAVRRYKASPDFRQALLADAYFRGENPTVARKTILQARKLTQKDANGFRRSTAGMQDVVGNRIGSAFLHRFVTQQAQFLLGNGCILRDADTKAQLGTDFDHQLAYLGERALLHGVSWLYWSCGHVEVIEAARDPWSGFCPLLDEMTGQLRAGIRFWQLGPRQDQFLQLFEQEGISLWRSGKDGPELVRGRQPYAVRVTGDAFGDHTVTEARYDSIPVIPLYANTEKRSELTPAIRSKIDAYDRILSDFADNLDRANDVYWVLNNFGGSAEDVADTLEMISRLKAVVTMSDGSGQNAGAEPHTIEVPYAARETALRLLHRALYEDYMALDMNELTGSSLTNVAIRTAAANLNLKADRFEWQVFRCVRALLRLLHIDTDIIRFQRQDIGNISETVADIAVMRGDIDHRTALKLNPYIQPDEMDPLVQALQRQVPSA